MLFDWQCPDCSANNTTDDPFYGVGKCAKCGAKFEIECDESWDSETGDEWFWFTLGAKKQ